VFLREPRRAGDLEVAEVVGPLDGGLEGDVGHDETAGGRGDFFAGAASPAAVLFGFTEATSNCWLKAWVERRIRMAERILVFGGGRRQVPKSSP